MATIDRDARKRTRVSSHEQKRIGWSVKKAGRLSVVAERCQVDTSTPYRWQSGQAAGPAEHAHLYVAQLSQTAETDASPFLVSLKVSAMRPELRKWSDQALIKEWWRLFDGETVAEAREERAGRGVDWTEFIAAHLEEAAIQERLVAVTEILVFERDINPRQYSKDGHRNIRPVS